MRPLTTQKRGMGSVLIARNASTMVMTIGRRSRLHRAHRLHQSPQDLVPSGSP